MEVKIVRSERHEGDHIEANVFLSLDGMLYSLGLFYIGPGQHQSTERYLAKIEEFERFLLKGGNHG